VKQIVFHPDADTEITEAAQYYEVRKPGLGADFLGEVERALDQISRRFPWSGSSQIFFKAALIFLLI